ncbi:hypothetical protein Hanom_Chr11g01002131 [Helianthus anomalus]
MLNQAQSNSLVVKTYKRLVEAESNCHRFECEVASLKSEDSIRSKTKQEISSLRSQVDRLKEQVSEAKEVNKYFQASAAVAHEARDKAVRELENVKLKFEKLEKKLSEVEVRNKAEQKEMQSSYDQLLANHHRLINGMFFKCPSLFCFLGSFISPLFICLDKFKLERACDRAVESHLNVVSDMKDMLTRYDKEMVELYRLSSELLLTK